jgi:glycosyltransferase involved in cell wall biosynthesis
LESLVERKSLGNQVEFLGFLDDINDVYANMKSSSVFVLPSEREGAGLVTLEANACQCPAITLDLPKNAATEVIESGTNGFLCDATVGDLSNAIVYALEKTESMEENCLKYSELYNWNNIAEQTIETYRNVCT